MRVAHYLETYRQSQVPRCIIIVDTETRWHTEGGCQYHQFRLGYAKVLQWNSATRLEGYPRVRGIELRRIADLWTLLMDEASRNDVVTVMGHNIGFDLQILNIEGFIREYQWEITRLVDAHPPTYMYLRRHKATIKFIDTYNIWPLPLSKIADELGHERTMALDFADNETELMNHCIRDTVVLADLIIAWRETIIRYQLGKFAPTIGAQAMASFRRIMEPRTVVVHNNEPALKLERRAMFGGRCEAYTIGHLGKVTQLDIRSCYPYLMGIADYPIRLIKHIPNGQIADLITGMIDYSVIADVKLETDKPAFPARDNLGNVCYPVGRYWTTLTTVELEYAMGLGAIVDVGEIAYYASGKIFTKWANRVLELRQQARGDDNAAMELSVKILANSLHGKFGQRGRMWKNVPDHIAPADAVIWIDEDDETGKHTTYRRRVDLIQKLVISGETRDSCPSIAAHVTATARRYLWAIMEQAGLEHVHYIDTDGLIVDDIGHDNLRSEKGNAPGRLHEQASGYCIVYGVKEYQISGRMVQAGLPGNAKEIDPGVWTYERFEPWRMDGSQIPGVVRVIEERQTRRRQRPPKRSERAELAERVETPIMDECGDLVWEEWIGDWLPT